MIHLEVFHGCLNHENKRDNIVYFSSQKWFAEDYGDVEPYLLTLRLPFQTSTEDNINFLLEHVPELVDPYSGETFHSYEELKEIGVLYHDTWEIFEPLIPQIKSLGYDGMIIYEGGVENFVSFYAEQYRRLSITQFAV